MRKVIIAFITMLLLGSILTNRVKRRLVFNTGSRFFIRMNVRENLFQYTTIFTYALGFRMNFDLPDKVLRDKHRTKIRRRDLYKGIEQFVDQNYGSGEACVQKFICESTFMLKNSPDFVAQLFSIIFKPQQHDTEDKYSVNEDVCQNIREQCPLSILQFLHNAEEVQKH